MNKEAILSYIDEILFNIDPLPLMLRQGHIIDSFWKAQGITDQLKHLRKKVEALELVDPIKDDTPCKD